MKTMEQFNRALDELGVKINLLSKEVKDEYKKQAHDLKGRWNMLKEKLNTAADKSGDAWENVKESFKNGMAEVQMAYDDLKNRIK